MIGTLAAGSHMILRPRGYIQRNDRDRRWTAWQINRKHLEREPVLIKAHGRTRERGNIRAGGEQIEPNSGGNGFQSGVRHIDAARPACLRQLDVIPCAWSRKD